jgi:hypothetical protein
LKYVFIFFKTPKKKEKKGLYYKYDVQITYISVYMIIAMRMFTQHQKELCLACFHDCLLNHVCVTTGSVTVPILAIVLAETK